MSSIISGIILGITIAAPIGPTNIETIRRGFRDGWKSAFSFTLGVMLALVLYLGLATIGLSYLTQYKSFNLSLLGFGTFVLLYLAYGGLMGYLNKEKINLSSNVDSKKHFVPGIILTIGNPGLLAFWTG
ncbi:MAG: LysE family transporter, partial [Candidatus Gracilibacteria bacterium]